MATLNQLEKANKVLERIKKLDKEIKELDKMALLVATGEVKCNISLSIDNIGKENEDKNKVVITEDGMMDLSKQLDEMRNRLFGVWNVGGFTSEPEKSKNKVVITEDLTESTTLSVLRFLLLDKQTKRSTEIKKLKDLGFDF